MFSELYQLYPILLTVGTLIFLAAFFRNNPVKQTGSSDPIAHYPDKEAEREKAYLDAVNKTRCIIGVVTSYQSRDGLHITFINNGEKLSGAVWMPLGGKHWNKIIPADIDSSETFSLELPITHIPETGYLFSLQYQSGYYGSRKYTILLMVNPENDSDITVSITTQ